MLHFRLRLAQVEGFLEGLPLQASPKGRVARQTPRSLDSLPPPTQAFPDLLELQGRLAALHVERDRLEAALF